MKNNFLEYIMRLKLLNNYVGETCWLFNDTCQLTDKITSLSDDNDAEASQCISDLRHPTRLTKIHHFENIPIEMKDK